MWRFSPLSLSLCYFVLLVLSFHTFSRLPAREQPRKHTENYFVLPFITSGGTEIYQKVLMWILLDRCMVWILLWFMEIIKCWHPAHLTSWQDVSLKWNMTKHWTYAEHDVYCIFGSVCCEKVEIITMFFYSLLNSALDCLISQPADAVNGKTVLLL